MCLILICQMARHSLFIWYLKVLQLYDPHLFRYYIVYHNCHHKSLNKSYTCTYLFINSGSATKCEDCYIRLIIFKIILFLDYICNVIYVTKLFLFDTVFSIKELVPTKVTESKIHFYLNKIMTKIMKIRITLY